MLLCTKFPISPAHLLVTAKTYSGKWELVAPKCIIYCKPTVCTVATVSLPVGIFLCFFKESNILRLSTELNCLGMAFLQCMLVSWKIISWGMDGKEKERFILDPPLVGCSLCTSRLHWQQKDNPVCGFINMGRCDSHTRNNHLATATLPRERGSLVPFMTSGLSWKSSYSPLQKNAASVDIGPAVGFIYDGKKGEKGQVVEKFPLPVACWHILYKCLRKSEYEPGCENQQISFSCLMKEERGRCQCIWTPTGVVWKSIEAHMIKMQY